MKTYLSVMLMMMASLAFVLVGCTENSAPIAGPNDQALSSPTLPTALAKGSWVMMATGSGGQWWQDAHWAFAFTAQKDADGVKGQIQVYDRSWGENSTSRSLISTLWAIRPTWWATECFLRCRKNSLRVRLRISRPAPGYGMVLLTDNGQGEKGRVT